MTPPKPRTVVGAVKIVGSAMGQPDAFHRALILLFDRVSRLFLCAVCGVLKHNRSGTLVLNDDWICACQGRDLHGS